MSLDNLPKDPMMLLSFVNTRLRDDKINLDEFSIQFGITSDEITKKLLLLDYHYDEKLNKFI